MSVESKDFEGVDGADSKVCAITGERVSTIGSLTEALDTLSPVDGVITHVGVVCAAEIQRRGGGGWLRSLRRATDSQVCKMTGARMNILGPIVDALDPSSSVDGVITDVGVICAAEIERNGGRGWLRSLRKGPDSRVCVMTGTEVNILGSVVDALDSSSPVDGVTTGFGIICARELARLGGRGAWSRALSTKGVARGYFFEEGNPDKLYRKYQV